MVKPFFSVIIPCLNEEKYLPQLLEDLTAQTYKNFEVIVVDGKSDDQTRVEAEKYIQKLFSLIIINSDKRNLPYQRNLGAKKSQGNFLIFFDADVQVPPNFLSEIYQALAKQQVDYLTTWIDVDKNSFTNHMIKTMTNLFIEVVKMIDKPFVCGGNAIVSRNAFFAVGGYRENIKFHEDYDLSIRLNNAGFKLYVLKKPKIIISLRRVRKDGIRKSVKNYAIYTSYFFLKGAPTTDIFKYKMGGHVYKKDL